MDFALDVTGCNLKCARGFFLAEGVSIGAAQHTPRSDRVGLAIVNVRPGAPGMCVGEENYHQLSQDNVSARVPAPCASAGSSAAADIPSLAVSSTSSSEAVNCTGEIQKS